MITFTKQENGIFEQSGELATSLGRFEWRDHAGQWRGTGLAEPMADLIERMGRTGPYRYSAYRVVEATKPALVIKPTCAGCGMIAGVNCQHAADYIFGTLPVAPIPLEFNEDHQITVSVSVQSGARFKTSKAHQVVFNSVRCAELVIFGFTAEYGARCGWCGEQLESGRYCSKPCEYRAKDVALGSGVRLAAYLAAHGSKKQPATAAERMKKHRSKRDRLKAAIWADQTAPTGALESKG